MNYVKITGLIAVAAMALMALFGTGTASATVLCKTATSPCPVGETYSGTIKGSLASGTSAVMKDTSGNTLNTCTGGTAEGSVSAGGASSTVTGNTTSLSLTGCNAKITNLSKCEGELHYISGTNNGTATVKGCEFTSSSALFGSCVYSAGPGTTDVGIVEEGKSGEAAKVSKVANKVSGASCPSTIVIEMSVVRTAPEGTLGFASS